MLLLPVSVCLPPLFLLEREAAGLRSLSGPFRSIVFLTMRFNAALASALVSSAGLMGYVHAEDEVPAPDTTSSAVERPTFTVRDLPV